MIELNNVKVIICDKDEKVDPMKLRQADIVLKWHGHDFYAMTYKKK